MDGVTRHVYCIVAFFVYERLELIIIESYVFLHVFISCADGPEMATAKEVRMRELDDFDVEDLNSSSKCCV